jgi:hypothetical protein
MQWQMKKRNIIRQQLSLRCHSITHLVRIQHRLSVTWNLHGSSVLKQLRTPRPSLNSSRIRYFLISSNYGNNYRHIVYQDLHPLEHEQHLKEHIMWMKAKESQKYLQDKFPFGE